MNLSKPFIALDLELEQPASNPQTPDSAIDKERIIQVGWTVFMVKDDGNMDVLSYMNKNIHYPYKLSKFIKNLTKIRDEDVNNPNFPCINEVAVELTLLRESLDANRHLITWGQGDKKAMEEELGYPLRGFGRAELNVKHLMQMYCMMNGMNTSGGLAKSLGKLGLKFDSIMGYGKHNAMTDSYNTAKIFSFLVNKLTNKKRVG